jgi:N-acetylneuraminate-binding protein
VLEGMAAGVADITCESVGTLAPFTNLANIDIMPYIYNGYDHFQAVWGGELGQEILDTVGNDSGFKLIGAGYRGARIVTATKEMKTVEDFAGFKLRSPNLEGYIKVWEWMGSAPTPLAMGETYTALQQGTVDGQENSILDSQSYSFQEVCPYWILTNHVYSANTIIMDKAYFESLPEDIQSALEEAAVYAGEQIGQEVLEREDAAKEELTAEGVTFVDVDNAAFTEHFSGYAEANFPDLADWCNQIRALAPNA